MSNEKQPVPSTETPVVIKWDELIPVFTDIKEQLTVFSDALYKTEATYSLILKDDEELTKEMNGAFGAANDLVIELTKVLGLHSINDKGEIKPFIGIIDPKDDAATEIYTNAVIAYDALNNRIGVIMEQVTSHLVAKINAAVELKK